MHAHVTFLLVYARIQRSVDVLHSRRHKSIRVFTRIIYVSTPVGWSQGISKASKRMLRYICTSMRGNRERENERKREWDLFGVVDRVSLKSRLCRGSKHDRHIMRIIYSSQRARVKKNKVKFFLLGLDPGLVSGYSFLASSWTSFINSSRAASRLGRLCRDLTKPDNILSFVQTLGSSGATATPVHGVEDKNFSSTRAIPAFISA